MPDRRPEDTSATPPVSPPRETPDSGTSEPPPPATEGKGGPSAPGKGGSGKAVAGKAVPEKPSSEKAAPDTTEERPTKQAKASNTERFAAVLAATKGTAQAKEGGTREGPAPTGVGRGPVPKATAPATARSATPKRVRRARLRLTHVDPLSVMKTSFLLSVAIGIVTVVAVAIVWALLGAAGLWDSIDSAITDVLGDSSDGFRIEDYVGTGRVLGFTMIVAVVDVVLITVIATLAAFLYNLAAALLGGIEVVLAEEDR